MKTSGDGFLSHKIKRYKCPYCNKKGFYYIGDCGIGLPPYRCMYCKKTGYLNSKQETK